MRDRIRGCAVGAALVVVVTACTGSADPTTTTAHAVPTTSVLASTTTTEDPILNLALPVDPDVVQGVLDNGMTYYIRENDSPGGRAELRLLVDAGSVQEDPDQAGMAHFLEHMMFNGTENYPRNDLIDVLEAFGPRFGPDINAFTSYDETVYELSLTTDNPELLVLGVDVLREWATRATLTETDVVEERGVILDEWRTRAQGFAARVNEQIESLVLPGTIYEGHQPIGNADSIETTSPQELARFYEDWYHPERMAIVAVGDFDAAAVEDLIEDSFGDIPPADGARAWETPGFEAPTTPRAVSFVDEEATIAGVTVMWPTPNPPMQTVGDYQRSLATSFGMEILANRLSDDASAGDEALLGAAVVDLGWTRAFSIEGVDAEVRASQVDAGMVKVLHEVERIRREGISEDEFQRQLAGYESFSRQIYEQRESAQDLQFTSQIVAHHLAGAHLMSPGQRFDVESGILARITADDVDAALLAIVERSPVVLVVGPDDAGLDIPDETRILEVVAGMPTAELGERRDVEPGEGELMDRPEPARIVSSTIDPRFEFTTLHFDNGATVYLWESDIASESVFGIIEGFGGTSQVEVEDLPEAFLMSEIVGRSGVAGFDVPTLRRLLAGAIVGVFPWITETRQGLEVTASIEDVETMFQLIHLTMADPRFDDTAIDAVLNEMETLNASRDDVPDLLFEEALNALYYGEDPRYFVIPSSGELAEFDVAVAERLFNERFGDAADFAFAFVGDFDTADMTELAASYIGTLPGSGEPSSYVDHQPLPPREVQVRRVEAGIGEQGRIGMFFTNEFEGDLLDRLHARLVELILTARLRERIREELSATYSIQAGIDLQRDPDRFAEAFITSTGDPSGLDQIAEEILAGLQSLQDSGPTGEEFATAIEQLRDELELLDNRTLANALITSHLYPDQPVAEVADRYQMVDSLTPEEVQLMARVAFDLDQRIEVRLVPRT
ncbi:MAG TPA: insulinase family protein [Acidimicrobiia bacterium]